MQKRTRRWFNLKYVQRIIIISWREQAKQLFHGTMYTNLRICYYYYFMLYKQKNQKSYVDIIISFK